MLVLGAGRGPAGPSPDRAIRAARGRAAARAAAGRLLAAIKEQRWRDNVVAAFTRAQERAVRAGRWPGGARRGPGGRDGPR